jgi:hypothetical protein
MRWTRKNAAPVTADALDTKATESRGQKVELECERDEIVSALPDLVSEPERALEAETRLREIEAELPHKRRALALIEAAMPEAERREKGAAIQLRLAPRRLATLSSASSPTAPAPRSAAVSR